MNTPSINSYSTGYLYIPLEPLYASIMVDIRRYLDDRFMDRGQWQVDVIMALADAITLTLSGILIDECMALYMVDSLDMDLGDSFASDVEGELKTLLSPLFGGGPGLDILMQQYHDCINYHINQTLQHYVHHANLLRGMSLINIVVTDDGLNVELALAG